MRNHAMDRSELTRFVKDRARAVGFDRVGVAAAGRARDAGRLRAWLEAGRHGEMAYLERHFEQRVDPRALLPGARSVVSVALGYYTPHPGDGGPGCGKISRYAWGDDYHDIVKERLFALRRALEAAVPGLRARCCVDTAPILEKYWAVAAGIGWLGKHGCVITPECGSWVFLGELVLDCELDADAPLPDRCGTCRRCLEACPTGALAAPSRLDATRCLSYWTIESRADCFPPDIRRALDGRIFGCDICQEVCPWNRKLAQTTPLVAFAPRLDNMNRPLRELLSMDEPTFRRRFRSSPVRRAKWPEFVRNLLEAAASGA
ncbi:MAG: tRNA epoxyqueuosine(34) reductase QueG [Planctomycetes bacterium]|nr:tRNA epoxyqueuosine(34) reductase QueG [Planctomycetota bacterium]